MKAYPKKVFLQRYDVTHSARETYVKRFSAQRSFAHLLHAKQKIHGVKSMTSSEQRQEAERCSDDAIAATTYTLRIHYKYKSIIHIHSMAISEAWVDFIAGWGSGAVSVLMCQPVDTVLTRFQANASTTTAALQETRYMLNQNGFTSLWRGSSAMISAVPMQNAMLMGGYGVGKKWSSEGGSSNNIYRNVFVGGCFGGVAQSFLMSPVELMKVNQQVNVSKSATEAGMELVSGLSRFAMVAPSSATSASSSWRGLNATLLRDGIPHGVW